MPSSKPTGQADTRRPEDHTPEQITADLDWLRNLRAETSKRWGGIVGGHDAFLDTLDTSGQAEAVA